MSNIGARCFAIAMGKGFYDDYNRVKGRLKDPADLDFLEQIWLSHRLMLIVSELAEGLEAIRDKNFSTDPKSGGLGEELADARIRLEDLFYHVFGRESIVAVAPKMDYNETRPYKHGRSL